MPGNITALSPEVQAQIRSSVRITSISDVVVELVKNSLDAGAKVITIRVDFVKGFCSVQDDGEGIPKEEFLEHGRLVQLYHTSRLGSSTFTYGRFGRFLASLAGVSLLLITSRHRSDDSVNSIAFDESGRLASHVDIEEHDQSFRYSGTKVVVYNLFGKLPVRVKHRAAHFEDPSEVDKEFEVLRKCLVALVLANLTQFKLDIREDFRDGRYVHNPPGNARTSRHVAQSPFSLPQICSALVQAGYIGRQSIPSWRFASIQSKLASVNAVFSLDPVPNKRIQFISFGQLPVTNRSESILFDVVNSLFDNSTFGSSEPDLELSEEENEPRRNSEHLKTTGQVLRQFSMRDKCIERWPMFYIRIDTEKTVDVSIPNEDSNRSEDSQKFLTLVVELLRSLVTEFLQSNGFQIMKLRRRTKRNRFSKPVLEDFQSTSTSGASSSTPFDQWPRIKHSRNFPATNILAGLPFRDEKVHASRSRETDVPIVPSNLGKMAAISSSGTPEMACSIDDSSFSNTDIAEAISWVNPRNGRTILLNPRTGAVLPQRASNSSLGIEVDAQDGSDSQRRLSKDNPFAGFRTTRSLAEVAQNFDNHSCFYTPTEPPIKSIVPTETPVSTSKIPSGGKERYDQLFRIGSESLQARLQYTENRITRAGIKHATIVQQVDEKFILALVPSFELRSDTADKPSTLLVLIDQHAADERCKVEYLYQSFSSETPTTLSKPLVFEVSFEEAQILGDLKNFFAGWQILYDVGPFSSSPVANKKKSKVLTMQNEDHHRVSITALPDAIAERCRMEPKLAIDILREEAWSDRDHRLNARVDNLDQQTDTLADVDPPTWTRHISHMPGKLLDLVNSRACRSSIMFNDVLNIPQCEELVKRLGECVLPFQCAHGRPSMVILAQLPATDDERNLLQDMNIDDASVGIASSITNNIELRELDKHTRFGSKRKDIISDETHPIGQRKGALDRIETSFGKAFVSWTSAANRKLD